MIIKVDMYAVQCDNCGEDLGAISEYSAWNDEEAANDDANNHEWHKEGNKHFCPVCHTFDDNDKLVIRELKDKNGNLLKVYDKVLFYGTKTKIVSFRFVYNQVLAKLGTKDIVILSKLEFVERG